MTEIGCTPDLRLFPNAKYEAIMKNVKKTVPVIASAFISLCFLVGCAESVVVTTDELIRDLDVSPTQSATYEQYSKKAIEDYFAVADGHVVGGETDYENEEVIAAASEAAAKLFAYACYNERTLDQYVFFAAQEGTTDISAGSAHAMKQEYYLRINETEKSCGYRYHYTIKYADCTGALSMFRDLFQSARTRITDETDLLYRLEGSNIRKGEKSDVFEVEMLECDWATGKDWGVHEIEMIKGDYIEPDKIEEDIVAFAGEDDITIRANINILAENMVKHAVILPDASEENGVEGYLIFMTVDTDVANNDEASLKMLRRANGSNDCEWVSGDDGSGLSIVFRIWENGLFRMYSVAEKWQGKINGFAGTADSSTQYYYSYSDRDCDMTKYLEMLEEAKTSKGE